MKKKYLALMMACIMCSSVFMSGCGKTADTVVEDEDEDEDDDDDREDTRDRDEDDDREDTRDRDEDDDEEEDEDVYIDVIDGEDLEKQIDLIIKNRDEWTIDTSITNSINAVSYGITDLDHNGRAEVFTVIGNHTDHYFTEFRIFEVDEDCKSLEDVRWKTTGLEYGDDYPDTTNAFSVTSFYDKKKNITHYMMANVFDAEDETGSVFCDVSMHDGKITCHNYAAMIIGHDYMPDYYTDDGTAIKDDADFADYLQDYPGKKQEQQYFGLLVRDGSHCDDITFFSDEELKTMLTGSYGVFSGDVKTDDFDSDYNAYTTGSLGDISENDFYMSILGDWYLYSSEIEGDVTYYDSKSENYSMMTLFAEEYVVLTEYYKGDQSFRMMGNIDYDQNGSPCFIYDDPDGLPENIDYELFTLSSTEEDGKFLEVYLDFYTYEDGWLGGYNLTFKR